MPLIGICGGSIYYLTYRLPVESVRLCKISQKSRRATFPLMVMGVRTSWASPRVVQETMGNLLFGKLPCKLLCKLPFLQGKGYKACK